MSTQADGIDATCKALRGSVTCLARGSSAGLMMAVAASLLSLGSVLYAFYFIAHTNRHSKFRIFHNSMDILVFSLLVADMVQAIGGLLNLKWIHDGIVQTGGFCTAQGTLKTFGETAVALTTLLIAIFTFLAVSTGKGIESRWITAVLVVGLWIFIGILIGAGHAASRGPYMSPVPYWCWIGSSVVWKLVGEYLWMWTSLFASCILYVPLYLWLRGNLGFPLSPESKWYSWSFQWTLSDASHSRRRQKSELVMLLYPIVYCICILPLSVVRWISFDEEAKHGSTGISPGWTFAVITIFGLSGFLNVILVLTTRPKLGLFGRHEESSSGRSTLPATVNQSRCDEESGVEGISMGRLPTGAPGGQRVVAK